MPLPSSTVIAPAPTFGFRPALRDLQPYSAGRGAEAVRRELGISGRIVKLASNEGPDGPFPSALEAMAEEMKQSNRYPEPGFGSLRRAIAEKHGVPVERVLVGGGGSAILHHLAMAFLDPEDEVAYCAPTFTAYRLEALKMGATPRTAPLTAAGSFNLHALLSLVGPRTKLVYVCNPNNPTGGTVTRASLSSFLEALPHDVLPILDEAYFEYVDNPEYPDSVAEYAEYGRPLVALRTFSKIYGLAGLRVAYAVAPDDVVRACMTLQNPFEVNRLGLAAALASLNADEELTRRRAANRVGRERLAAGLRGLGLDPLPSEANFLAIRVGDGDRVAAALEMRGVIVRSLGSMGDPSSIRITVGTLEEIDFFLHQMDEVLAEM